MVRISKKARRIIVLIAGNAGAPFFAITTFMLVGRKAPILGILLSIIAGTVGYLLFTGLATLAARFVGRRVQGRAEKPVYAFGQLPQAADPYAGGKGRTLAQLYQAGYRVPDGCVILCTAFDGDDLRPEAWSLVEQQLARLRRADRDVAFAVRSSALSEDAAQTSFAGEFETVLDVKTDADIREAIRTVRRSRQNVRVQAYAEAQGLAETGLQDIAVVVQRLVRPDFAGVLFTADPVTGSLAQMVGNYVEGLGEKLVSGQVNPHTFTLKRPEGSYDGPPALSPVARALHDNACALEDDLGAPQDIEWAVAGNRLCLLQARPITTLHGYDPATGARNDTLTGNFLWSAGNLSEACPETMTPFTASLTAYINQRSGASLRVKHYTVDGIIGGRPYANISVQVSAFVRNFKGDAHRAYREMAEVWGEIPEDMEIPLIPVTDQEWKTQLSPQLLKLLIVMAADRRKIPAFVAGNRLWCAAMRQKIQQVAEGAALAALWETELRPYYQDALALVIAATENTHTRIQFGRELRELVGADDTNALLSNLSGLSQRLESLGPVVGLSQVIRGEISREAYLDAYGHRGVNETECAWPRPMEDPTWLDRQIAEASQAPLDVEARFAKQRAAYDAAWGRFCAQHPQQVKKTQRRLRQIAQGAYRREVVRSETVRVGAVGRAFALRAGELTGLGEDIFFLSIEEVLEALRGNDAARRFIPIRKATYKKYHALPPFPTLICGRFDPLQWAADPDRRSDIYAADAPTPRAPGEGVIQGFPGALGVVEGTVRRLERLEESDQLQPGEILVTTMTNIGWTPLFPRAAAIVTDLGAPLSHAAIVARELGIPAVVGCGDATMRLKTGDRVRVNGGQGIVEILNDADVLIQERR
ncbi:MAG TPA: PEP/pyruvate-binding domain-containing protein [Anaerolineae bacterium]|nr:PEP/pyruvate-binding domain-containing protein [Anaerolineae bacterium]